MIAFVAARMRLPPPLESLLLPLAKGSLSDGSEPPSSCPWMSCWMPMSWLTPMSPLTPLSPLPRALHGRSGGGAASRALRGSGVPPALRGCASLCLSTSMPSSMSWLTPAP